MKKAIISGATGLVGGAVARHLAISGVELLCLGRNTLDQEITKKRFGENAVYISLPMENIDTLPHKIRQLGWHEPTEAVFFHFAWSGVNRLTDGSLFNQLSNAVSAAKATETAKAIGCSKFINCGTILESYVDSYLSSNQQNSFGSSQTSYAIAKVAARDACKMSSYLNKIDYIHTRMSVPISPNLSQGGYVAATLKKISQGQHYDKPQEDHLFDIVSVDDVAKAYYLIGNLGVHKSDYFIGTGRPATLDQHFRLFSDLVESKELASTKQIILSQEPEASFFDPTPLQRDTGFVASSPFDAIVKGFACS